MNDRPAPIEQRAEAPTTTPQKPAVETAQPHTDIVALITDQGHTNSTDTLRQIAGIETKPEVKTPTVFDSINRNVAQLTDRIRKKEGNLPEQKALLSRLLQAREQFYLSIAQAINPDIQPVEGRNNMYKVGDRQIFGGIEAVLDASAALGSHTQLAERMRIKPSVSSDVLIGEEIPPKALLESSVVFSGSSAQDRVQPFGADIDMAEYIIIKAASKQEAGKTLARSLQSNVAEQIQIADEHGNPVALHFLELKVGGNFPDDAFSDASGTALGKDRKLRWSVAEIQQGYKEYVTSSGERRSISLENACQNPQMLKVDYVGVTPDSVVEITKVTTVQAQSSTTNETFFQNGSGQANAFQEVYFNDPTAFGVIEKTRDPDQYIAYITGMSSEVKKYLAPDHLNRLKAAKRMYNLCKAEGHLQLTQEISPIFALDSAAVYQLIDRLSMSLVAEQRGIDVSSQKTTIQGRLHDILSKNTHPNASQILAGMEGDHLDFNKIRDLAMGIVNTEVDSFIKTHPTIQAKIQEITG